MCGITGILAFDEQGKKKIEHLPDAIATIQHRGPDNAGSYYHNRVALGHRRLSIIDTSSNANQPFTDASGRYTIVYNGELFNYIELKNELIRKGIQFRSHSDTEVLLQLYILEPQLFLTKLDGEFAFAIYDREQEQLFLARDRFGIKPLYYYCDNSCFLFGSELSAVGAFGIQKTIDRASLEIYLHLNYIPAPYSIYENIHKLEPGHFIVLGKSGTYKPQVYYQLDQQIEKENEISYENAQKKLRELLQTSVQRRLIADVPVGTFLSGGIDSSILTALAARETKQLKTFSIGYADEPLFDETSYAELLAKKYRTDHHSFRLSNKDLYEQLNFFLNHLDEPFADSSALAVSILSMETRKHVKVVLSGDGADELFSGYHKHAAEFELLAGGWKTQLALNSSGIAAIFPKSRNSFLGNKFRQLEKFGKGARLSPAERYWLWAGFEHASHSLLLNPSPAFLERKNKLIGSVNGSINGILENDVKMVLEGDMLVKTDRMSMSHGLEVRVPFLNHELVQFALGLHADYKINHQTRKRILKDSFRDLLPEELLQRGKKGFEVPLLKWMQGDLRNMIDKDLLSDSFVGQQGLFNPEKVKKLKKDLFSKNPGDATARVWALLVFQFWWKKNGH